MGAIAAKTAADLAHRRLQAVVLALVLFLACAAATLALNILVASHEPFDQAFARANGAHLAIDFRGTTDAGAIAGTSSAEGVTATTGPWLIATGGIGRLGDGIAEGLSLSGRVDPLGPVDRVAISAGRWWRTPDEVVVSWETAQIFHLRVGDGLAVYQSDAAGKEGAGGPIPIEPGGKPLPRDPMASLTIVGIAQSVSTPNVAAWMSPTVIRDVAGDEPLREMLYRVEPASTSAEIAAAVAAITADIPAGAVAGTYSYLETRTDVDGIASLYVPVLLAFSVFALAAAAFTIANVVGGIVLTGSRQIGVMKAVGFTPGEVTTILAAQIMLPVAVGAGLGVVAGTLASVSTVERMIQSFGLPGSFTFSPIVLAAVLAICLAVAFVAALGPSIRAGRLSATRAISGGRMPSRDPDGGRLRRLGLRLPAPAPIRLGVAAGAAHPTRAAMTLGALLVGVAAATFAISLNLSLIRVMAQLDRNEASPVRASLMSETGNPAAVGAAITGNPDTERFVALGLTQVALARVGEVTMIGYDGDASWIGYELIRGRWFAGPGEVVAPTNVIRRAGLAIGDTIELANGGRTVSVRLVGEVFDTGDESGANLVLRGAFADVAALDPAATLARWEVRPVPGVTPDAYARWLGTVANGQVAARTLSDSSSDEEFLLFLSVVGSLGIVLVAMSLGGVFNTVLLETRHRVREMAVLKALGMAPRDVVAMVVASVVPVGILAGALGVPLGLAFQRAVLSYMGETAANLAIPESTFDVLPPIALAGLGLAGLAIAAIGAYGPAVRAARSRIAPVLQAE